MKKSVIICCAVIVLSMLSTCYMSRCLFWGGGKQDDYTRFPAREIMNGSPVYEFARRDTVLDSFRLSYSYKDELRQTPLLPFLKQTRSVSFMVIRNDTIIYEKYFDGYTDQSLVASFSIAKSVTSMLVGIALEEGKIQSIDDPVTNYLSDLEDPGCARISLRNLLDMTSGLRHTWDLNPFSDVARSYYSTDLRRRLRKVECEKPPMKSRHYNNYNTQLLGLVLEKVTGVTISNYLQEKVWKKVGMKSAAKWSIDNVDNGFELTMAGLSATTEDYARLGRLYLNKGNWNGEQIVPHEWVRQSTDVRKNLDLPWTTFEEMFARMNVSYGYCWWGTLNNEPDTDFFGWGLHEQYLYVIPSRNVIVLRFGHEWGEIDAWPVVLRQLALAVTNG